MNIRIKTLLLANVSLISFLLGIAIGIRQPILQRFALLEGNLMQKRLANVGETLIQQVEKLDSSAKAEAIWTEMYNYMENPNSNFYRQTYTFEGLSTSSLDVLGIFNIKGKSIHLDWVDKESRQLKPLPNAIAADLRREQQLLLFPDDNDPALARSRNLVVLQTRDKPLIVAVRPILTVNAEGPRQGTLLMGSFINHEFLALLEKHNNLKLNLAPVALEQPDIELVNIPSTRENRGNSQTIIKISPHTRILDNDWIVGEIYLLNSDRQPVQILQVKSPRLEYQQGETTLNQLTGVLFAIGIFLGIVISLLLDKSIRNQQLLKISETFLRLANQELQQLADRDGLTQIPNRRCFEQYLRDRWELATEEQLPFTLIMCDVDYFKRFNDTYGHLAGDECLRQVALAISLALKQPEDLVARYGGEEFAIILPNSNLKDGLDVAREIQRQIQNLQIKHADSPVSSYVSLSLGVSTTIPNRDMKPEDLIEQSDKKLYYAKQQGRNQIITSIEKVF